MKIFSEREIEAEVVLRKQKYFEDIKVGDKVKVPVGDRIRVVKVMEKYPNLIVAMSNNGYKVCFNIGDIVVAAGRRKGQVDEGVLDRRRKKSTYGFE